MIKKSLFICLLFFSTLLSFSQYNFSRSFDSCVNATSENLMRLTGSWVQVQTNHKIILKKISNSKLRLTYYTGGADLVYLQNGQRPKCFYSITDTIGHEESLQRKIIEKKRKGLPIGIEDYLGPSFAESCIYYSKYYDFIFFSRNSLPYVRQGKQIDLSNFRIEETVHKEAEFQKGEEALNSFIKANLNQDIPFLMGASPHNVLSTSVKFIIDKDGSVSNIIPSSNEYGIGQEAINLIKKTDGLWKPALKQGKFVVSYKTLILSFTLKNIEEKLVNTPVYLFYPSEEGILQKKDISNIKEVSFVKNNKSDKILSFTLSLESQGDIYSYPCKGSKVSDNAKEFMNTNLKTGDSIYVEEIYASQNNKFVKLPTRIYIITESDKIISPFSNRDAQMVQRVGNRINVAIKQYYQISDTAFNEWKFRLEDSKQATIFISPEGETIVSSGILPITQNEAALAVAISFVIAEFKNRPDSNIIASENRIRKADQQGLIFAAIAGYNPQEAIGFWDRMNKAGSGTRPPELLILHPLNEGRFNELKEDVEKALEYFKPIGN